MNSWTYVLLAVIIEVAWVLGLNYSTTALEWTGTGIAIIFSFYCVIKACETLPSSTVYAVFTGSGAAIIAAIDFIYLGSYFTVSKGLCIALIITGVVGIQLTTPEKPIEPITGSER